MQSLPYWAAALLLVIVAVVVFVTIFVWRWAVRQPPGAANGEVLVEGSEAESAIGEGARLYVAIGASDVAGVGAVEPERENWASVLHTLMPSGTRLLRLARPGITLREANAHEVFDAVRAQPDFITLWCCVNDITKRVPLSDYTRELEIALTRLTRETQARRVLVLNVPDISRLLPPSVSESQRALIRGGIQQWNRAIAATVARYGPRVTLLDLFDVSEETMSQQENVATDGFHLSAAGHRALALLAWEAIRET